MRLLAASDLHGNHALYRNLPPAASQYGAAAIVLAGDLLGRPDGHSSEEDAQRADAAVILELLSPWEGPTFYIMGNDDWIDLDVESSLWSSIHRKRIDFDSWNVVGYQCTLPFGGGTFERREEEIAQELESIAPLVDDRTIFVSHSPAFGILDRTQSGAAGSRSLAALIEKRKPRIHIHGHIHECFGRSGRHFNVAAGRHLRAMVIDVDRLEHEEVFFS